MTVKGSPVCGLSVVARAVYGTTAALDIVLSGCQEEFDPDSFVHQFVLKSI